MRLLLVGVLLGCAPIRHQPGQWTQWLDEYHQWRGNRTQSE